MPLLWNANVSQPAVTRSTEYHVSYVSPNQTLQSRDPNASRSRLHNLQQAINYPGHASGTGSGVCCLRILTRLFFLFSLFNLALLIVQHFLLLLASDAAPLSRDLAVVSEESTACRCTCSERLTATELHEGLANQWDFRFNDWPSEPTRHRLSLEARRRLHRHRREHGLHVHLQHGRT